MAYDNPDGLIAAAVVVQALVLVMIGLRFVSNRKRGLKFSISDGLIILAAVLSTALAIEQVYCAASGLFGVRVATKPTKAAQTDFLYMLRHHNYSFVVTGIVAIGAIKTSVSFFYLQIFSTPNFRPFIIAWIAFMTLWTAGFFTAFLAICGGNGLFSDRKFMDPKNVARYCGSTQKLDFGVLISGTVSDFVTVLLPIPMVMSLHLKLKEKLSVVAIFMVGMVSVGASIARSYIGIHTKFSPIEERMDAGLGVTATCVWTLIEVQVGILAACAPLIRPVLRDAVQNGLFTGILSSARSFVSKSSRSDISGPDMKRNGSEDEELKLDGRFGESTANVRRGSDVKNLKRDGIHVSTDFTVNREGSV